MRGFFLLLMLSNVGFFAWQYFEAKGKDEVVDVYRNIFIINNGLTLLSELPEAQRPALLDSSESLDDTGGEEVAKESEAVATDTNNAAEDVLSTTDMQLDGPICLQVGGIEEKAELDRLRAKLQTSDIEVLGNWKQQISEDNYWVYLPAYRSRRKANEAAGVLSGHRVKDFFVVRSGEHENAISLGVFSTKERANRRYQEIVDLKARLRKPKIEIMPLPATRFQVNFKVTDGKKVKLISDYLKKMKLSAATEIRCK